MVKKIVFIGPAAAGKTSTRKFLFEGTMARELLDNPEPPSIGMKFNKYSYMDVDLSLVDTAGQELEKWIVSYKDRVFAEADVVFYFFDVSEWDDPEAQMYIKDFISFTNDARVELAPGSAFHVIANKCDTVIQDLSGIAALEQRIQSELREYLFRKTGVEHDHPVHAASIVDPFSDMTRARYVEIITGKPPA